MTRFRFRDTKDIKSFLYLSKTKVDSFYHQLVGQPERKRKIEWKLTFPPVTRTSTKEEEAEPFEEEKLRLIIEALRETGEDGTVENPATFIEGTFPMRWGLFNDAGYRPENHGPLVYFGGIDKEKGILLGLGGSSHHVLGNQGIGGTGSRSHTPAIVSFLLSGLATGEKPEFPAWMDAREKEDDVYMAMAIALHYLKPPTQQLEFLAKTLCVGEVDHAAHFIEVDHAQAILATPLYVALTIRPRESNHNGLIHE